MTSAAVQVQVLRRRWPIMRRRAERAIQVLDGCFPSAAGVTLDALAPGGIIRRGRVRVVREAKAAAHAYSIGQSIRAARLRLGLTQADLAAKCGMARPNLARLEHGKHTPSTASLTKIANALGVGVSALLAPPVGRSAPPEERALAEAGLSDWLDSLAREDKRR